MSRAETAQAGREINGTAPSVMSGIRAVIFDWDGVLVDSSRNYYRAYDLVFREVGITTTAREIYLREGQPTPEVIAAICAERGVAITTAKVRKLVERRREHDIALGPRTYYPGTWDLLNYLRKSACKLALVTGSSRKSVKRILSAEQEGRFDAVVTADDVVRCKPDPEPFRKAAEMISVAPSNCLVVENAPFGVQAAQAAGCRVIAICTTLTPEDLRAAEWVVRDHQELQAIFAALNG
jgi:beta-phosphoglucomutase